MKTVCANARLQVISVILCCVGLQQIVQAQQFAPAVNYPAGRAPFSVAVGDFNQDGIPDLVVANGGGATSTVSIFLGNGDGTFRASREYDAGVDTFSVAVGDLNGDGKPDLVVANVGPSGNENIGVLLGNGDGTFMPVVEYNGPSPGSPFVAVGDFNGDGKLDVVTIGRISGSLGTIDVVSIHLGKGDGTLAPAGNYPTGASNPNPISIAVADLNGDGRLDLAVANNNSDSIGVLLGRGDGTFQAAVDYPVGIAPYGIASGDFNGDGKLDLVASAGGGATVSVLIGNGDGTFQAPVNYPAGDGPWSVGVGDFNTDGKLDLIVADFGGVDGTTVSLLLGNGDGTFQAPAPYIVGAVPTSVAVADLNSDGLLDVAVANAQSDNVSVLLNVGRPPVSPLLAALVTEVTGVGPGKSLANKVALAQTYYAAKDVQATCAVLTGFVNEVKAQAGKKIAHTLDAKLIADANAIETAIDCN
jgi:hypothetical protein